MSYSGSSFDEYFKAYLEEGHNLDRATTIKNLWKCIEKRAFESADILVFPSIKNLWSHYL